MHCTYDSQENGVNVTIHCPAVSGYLVRSSAFRRLGVMYGLNEPKGELQTGQGADAPACDSNYSTISRAKNMSGGRRKV